MYAHTHHQIAKDRVADMHRQARHDALARAARDSRDGRRPGRPQAQHRVPWLLLIAGRRVLTALGAHT
jgi:hypothetical protein